MAKLGDRASPSRLWLHPVYWFWRRWTSMRLGKIILIQNLSLYVCPLSLRLLATRIEIPCKNCFFFRKTGRYSINVRTSSDSPRGIFEKKTLEPYMCTFASYMLHVIQNWKKYFLKRTAYPIASDFWIHFFFILTDNPLIKRQSFQFSQRIAWFTEFSSIPELQSSWKCGFVAERFRQSPYFSVVQGSNPG